MILDNKLSMEEIIVLDGAIGSEIARLARAKRSASPRIPLSGVRIS